MFEDDLRQGLKKIGPTYSSVAEKQAQVVQMIKRYELKPELKTRVNQDIPGLRKKTRAFSAKPNNKRYWEALGSFERNGMVNIGLSRNFVRFMYPMVPMFFFIYMAEPVIHGNVYVKHYNNYQWESIYHKYGQNRMVYTDNTITRLA